MFKKTFAISAVLGLVVWATPAFALPNFSLAQLSTPGTERTLFLPQTADNSPVVYIGEALDPRSGQFVEGYAIIHYKDQAAKPAVKPPKGQRNQCYSFLASGAKWKTLESWTVNPTSTQSLESSFVFTNLTADIVKWEEAADGVVGNSAGVNILGDGSVTSEILVADTESPDNINEVYFANVSSPGAIAVTIVWGIFAGPPSGRELVEWDMIFDDTDYNWSASGEAGKMDFENIATHELGHSVGLADLYESLCSQETMYGYADYGEIMKRDLNAGDIAGVDKLY